MSPALKARLSWYGAGLLAGAAVYAIDTAWRGAVRRAFGWSHFVYDLQPAWLRWTYEHLWWLPWLIGLGLALLRLRRGTPVRFGAYAAGAVTPYIALVGFLVFRPALDQWRHERPFDPAAWRARGRTEDVMWPMRLRMVDDLLARHPLEGLPRDSVEALLGPRDSTSYWRAWDLVYYLGPERGLFRLDSEWLVIRFGPNGRVAKAQLVRD